MSDLSTCCKMPVEIEGDNREGTMYYVCSKCGEACDIVNPEKGLDKRL
jgi:hypothetical protein